MASAIGIAAFVIGLLFAIFFHELGHFLTARWSGIKVRQFFVGFGPTVWSYRKGRPEVFEDPETGELVERPETEYGVKALPLGGFVKIVGMSPFEDVSPEDQPRAFTAAPAWKRAVVLSAGSVTHMITAVLVLFLVFSVMGLPDPERPTMEVEAVERSIEGDPAPAFAAGLRPGDRILTIDGREVSDWDAFRDFVRARPGEPFPVTYRDAETGEVVRTTVVPAAISAEGERIGLVGLAPSYETTRLGPIAGAKRSVVEIGRLVVGFAEATPRAFTPQNLGLVPGQAPSEERAISIVGAGRIAAGLAARGQVVQFLFLFAMLNVFIGIFNMLPLPPLDGGHLLLLGIEKLRGGKPVDQRAITPIMAIVTSLLLIMAASLLFQDLFNPIDPFQ